MVLLAVAAYSMDLPTGIHLSFDSKKVPTLRNQLEVFFTASSEEGMYQASFSPYAPGASIISISYKDAFGFDSESYVGSFIVAFPSDGLYQVYGS
jgi:hypothetical protein